MASLPENSVTEWRYRLMSPMGVYPKCDIHVEEVSLVVSDNLISIASSESGKGEEILLKAAILCSSVAASDTFKFYAFPSYHHLLDPCLPSQLTEYLEFDILQKHAAEYAELGETVPEFDWYENAKGASLPPVLGGTDYIFTDHDVDAASIQQLYQAFSECPCVKLNGAVRSLVEANALSCHNQFRQEACGLLLDGLRLLQEVNGFHSDSAQLSTTLAQLGDSAEDYLISRQQMSQEIGPIDFHRLFVQSCTQIRKHLLSQESS